MTTVEDYFQKILVINRTARTDRWEQCLGEFARFDITKFERFDAYDHGNIGGHIGGNGGATSSHRAVLDVIAYHQWPRTLILEDDFKILHEDFHQKFSDMIGEVPDDWQMLYLGGHYGEKPQARVSKHVIHIGNMLTTSSYAVTWQMAREMAPVIYGGGPIDCLYFQFHHSHKCYILQPRLMVQRESFSDLQGRVMDNEPPMIDTRHEEMV